MKLSLLSSSLAILLAVQSNAAPLRVLLIDAAPVAPPSSNIRFGHAIPSVPSAAAVGVMHSTPVANIQIVPTQGASGHQSCRMRQKAIAFSNIFREAVGLPPIPLDAVNPPPAPVRDGKGAWKILPFIGTPPTFVKVDSETGKVVSTAGGDDVKVVVKPQVQPSPHHHHGHHRHHHGFQGAFHRGSTFMMRLHQSLMALGPWEGRAVAFVLGCGIGVLLRMFWVLIVISYRSIKGDRSEEEQVPHYDAEYTHILLEAEPAEVIFAVQAPPQYVDEKAPVRGD